MLVLMDIDGTMTEERERKCVPELMIAISKAIERGHEIGLITGRDLRYCEAIHNFFSLNGPIIAETGCVIEPDYAKRKRETFVLGMVDENFRKELVSLYGTRVNPNKKFMATISTAAGASDSAQIDERELDELYDEIRKIAPRECRVFRTTIAVDAVPRSAGKDKAVKWLLESRKMEGKELAVIGDSKNDFDAFTVAINVGGRAFMVGEKKELREEAKEMGAVISPQGLYGAKATEYFLNTIDF